ncbi:Uu.00g005350.m01.CDS01 [Anthostomella pinea]|uniref:Pre-rRNA-processing protein RIX1 n=1 Tax=Anthostomella pinea TaxID=933095 RepID=A0AAI8YIW1_9PEZI|nr:Uu.00g005350.m01.CDS01 [Anthostomella pinea]
MALVTLPPELRSICRRLTSTKVEQLPSLLPRLLKDVFRCQEPLSRPQESKAAEGASEAAQLVNKLKTQITTLLEGRTVQGHFVGVVLVKAVIESGGWECLRASERWVRGILSILQRKDPAPTKDLCLMTLTKIYVLMHGFPTLVREIASDTLPTFAKACLQILTPPASSKAPKPPYSLIETIFEAVSTLVPLYPTTFRPFAGKFRADARPFSAPTISDSVLVPSTLRESSRRLTIRLHMTAPKGGDSTEWIKSIEASVRTVHSTADQVFRAINESWESTSGYTHQSVNFDLEPHGGGGNAEHLPPWVGVQAGSERMIGLLDLVADYLRCRTKTSVSIPVSAIVDLTARVSSIMPPSLRKEKFESVQMNAAVGREERDELWSVFPDIQIAIMRLLHVMVQRLGRNFVPMAQESLEQVLRMFGSSYRLPQVRSVAFLLVKELLCLCGPTMGKITVEGLSLMVKSCCRDLLGAAGHLKRPKPPAATQNGSNPKTLTQNADAFLPNKAEDEHVSVTLDAEHLLAAEELLTALFSHVPRQYLPSSLRSQMLKTAILSRNKDAQVASVLQPARDRSGRTLQVILPYLTRQFPQDQSVEILRFNFRPLATGKTGDFMDVEDDDMIMEDDDEPEVKPMTNGFSFGQPLEDSVLSSGFNAPEAVERPKAPSPAPMRTAGPIPSPFFTQPSEMVVRTEAVTVVQPAPTLPLKRKSEDAEADITTSKRVEIDTMSTSTSDNAAASLHTASQAGMVVAGLGEDDESDDESVHLNMELDSDSDDDDDDDDGDGDAEE